MNMIAIKRLFRSIFIAGSILILVSCGGSSTNSSDNSTQPVTVKLIAFNDFHGYLTQDDPENKIYVSDSSNKNATSLISVGGGAYMATLINNLRSTNANHVVIAAGDLIGASPAISSLTQDEATIDFMNLVGLDVSAVGNHEFDRGLAELKRLQSGGCAPGKTIGVDTCLVKGQFSGARFKYLAANVTDPSTQKTIFDPTFVKSFGSVSVGFIGLTLKDTPAATRGTGNLQFADEIATINSHATTLKNQGVDAVVVLLHQGGVPDTAYVNQQQSCTDIGGSIKDIVVGIKNIDVVISGHTHREYVCNNVAGTNVLLTQASLYGNIVTSIDLTIKPKVGVTAKVAKNIPVVNEFNRTVPAGYEILSKNQAAVDLIKIYDDNTRNKRNAVQGYIVDNLIRVDDSNGARINIAEHPIGYVVADAFLKAAIDPPAGSGRTSIGNMNNTIAFINPGGLRNSINKVGNVSFDDLFSVAPFSNNLYSVDLTGAQIIRLLEQQWEDQNCGRIFKGICGRILQPSSNFVYEWDISKPRGVAKGLGAVVNPSSVKVNGVSINPAAIYKVVTVDFLATGGGDNYSEFLEASANQSLELFDLDSIFEYFNTFNAGRPLPLPNRGRISCIGVSSDPTIACSEIPVSCKWNNLPVGTKCQ
jgi:5'-nucleotidase